MNSYNVAGRWAREIRRELHMNPELSNEEYETSQKILNYLKEIGVEGIPCARTGVVAEIKGREEGRVVAIRADIDALPIEEIEGRSYGSKNKGVMHACGHDAHTAILLGVARVLVQMKDDFKGSIRLLFQPAEETIGGAERMIVDKAMEGVDVVIGLHVMSYLEKGSVELKYGKLNASSDTINIEVKGLSSHGAYPDLGIDAIVAASHVITALQSIVSRRVSPYENVVLSFGRIEGGTRGNIISDSVKVVGTLRTTNEDVRKQVKIQIKEVVENISKAMGAKGEVRIEPGYMSLTNTNEVVDVIKETSEEVLGGKNIQYKENPSLGVEDFSFFIDKAKEGGAFYHLGCGNKELGITAPAHNKKFDIDEDCLELGIELQVRNILKLLKK